MTRPHDLESQPKPPIFSSKQDSVAVHDLHATQGLTRFLQTCYRPDFHAPRGRSEAFALQRSLTRPSSEPRAALGLSREVCGASAPGEGLRRGRPLHGLGALERLALSLAEPSGLAAGMHALLCALATLVVLLQGGHLLRLMRGLREASPGHSSRARGTLGCDAFGLRPRWHLPAGHRCVSPRPSESPTKINLGVGNSSLKGVLKSLKGVFEAFKDPFLISFDIF